MKINLFAGKYESEYNKTLDEIEKQRVFERIWEKDYTLWSEEPTEITNRLGWLEVTKYSEKYIDEINDLLADIKNDGITDILLLGMGGSSLAPEVFSKIMWRNGFPKLHVLDSTHPDEVKKYKEKLSPQNTFYIVSTKSGGTIETLSFFKYFYFNAAKQIGNEEASNHFCAITDPGSALEQMAKDFNFRSTFINDSNIGGRFSALSLFGIVPAILCGVNGYEFLGKVDLSKYKSSDSDLDYVKASALISSLGAIGLDKLSFFVSKRFSPLGAWAEQLIAESTGKIGKGILPVLEDEILPVENITSDRMPIIINLSADDSFDKFILNLKENNIPFVQFIIEEDNELAVQFFIWELITSVIGWKLKIQPFDQPDVESAKIAAREFITKFNETGELPTLETDDTFGKVNLISGGKYSFENLEQFLNKFCNDEGHNGRSYVSIHAYVPYDLEWKESLEQLKNKFAAKLNCAVTLGYGPRFLHSTGQLHKGDAGKGLFVQIFAEPKNEINIPEIDGSNSGLNFGNLVSAQSMGDRQALLNNSRNVLRFESSTSANETIEEIIKGLKL